MANVKISELPVAASVDGASSFPVVEGGVTKQVTFTGMLASPSLFASGMATFFATPSSANLRAALTDETGTGAAVFADSPTLVGPTVSSGNVTFSGTAQRITGDFSNATLASRVMFQTSTANGNSTPALIPNGTATTAGLLAINNSDPTNASFAAVLSLSGVMQVVSGITGTGTYLPMAFLTGGAERVRVDTSGNVLVGTTSNPFTSKIVSVSTGSTEAATLKNDTYNFNTAVVWNAATSNDNQFVQFGTEASYTVRGSITYNRAGGLVAYNTTSDYRAKDILGPVANPGATIDALKVHIGKMKGAAVERPMLVAHEAQEVAPYAVTGKKDAVNDDGTPKYQQIDVSSLVPLLIAEIQSLRARVAALEA
jgi:hypothetical protein